MTGVRRTLRIAMYILLAFFAFALSLLAGKKRAEVSSHSFVSSPYTYADAPYAEGSYGGSAGDGGGDGSGSGCGGSSDSGGGADGSGCGSSGG